MVRTAFQISALLAVFATLTSAQVVPVGSQSIPSGFFPNQPDLDGYTGFLDLRFGSNVIDPPGELIPRQATALPPSLGYSVAPMPLASIFLIDADALRSNGARTTLLHWFVPNVPLTNGDVFKSPLSVPVPGDGVPGVTYLQPSPPDGDIPHRYVFLLYAQYDGFALPADFSPPASVENRIGFNVTAFAKEAGLTGGLTEAPIAANWFTVQNSTGISNAAQTTVARATDLAKATATAMPLTAGANSVSAGAGWAVGIGGLCAAMWYMMF